MKTNCTCARSLAHASRWLGEEPGAKLPEGPGSLARFTRAAGIAAAPAVDPAAAYPTSLTCAPAAP